MDKRFIVHILTVCLYFIIISSTMLAVQNISDEMKKQYMEQSNPAGDGIPEKDQDPTPESIIIPIDEFYRIDEEKIKIPIDEDKELTTYFGYDYFFKRESISIYENLPAPKNYQFGPGDEIIINIWGDMQVQSAYTINKDGKVYIDKLGQLSIVGKTISQAETSLKKRFETVFSTMGGPNPSTFFDLSIGKLKSININIIGEALVPGLYTLHPFSTISTALIQSGGIDTTGTLRSIKLIRNGNESAELDFYDFLNSGKMIDDINLKDGDVIFIPLRSSSIVISGAVYRNAIFELKDNENFGDLLNYCGGLKISAQDMVIINRIIPLKDRHFEDFAHEVVLIHSYNKNFQLRDGDIVEVKEIYDVNRSVSISGTVKMAGTYPFIKGMTIMNLLEQAGGLYDESFVKRMDLEKVELVRRDKDKEYPIKYDISVGEILKGDTAQDIKLKNWDVVHVRRNINFDTPEYIKIAGEVKSPGSYTLLKRVETLSDIIDRSGGYTDRAFSDGIKIFRDDTTQIILKNFKMPLMHGDSIIVPQHTSVVEVKGEIYHPGYVQYIIGKDLDYYIDSAGGFTLNADQNSIMVIYANGDVNVKRRLHKLEITEGCHIVVQREKMKEDLNFTELLKEITSILASLATVVFIILSN